MRFLFFLILTVNIGAIERTESEWRQLLGQERYNVMRKKETERPYRSSLLSEIRKGIYSCAACKESLFKSEDKYREPNSGWPAFTQPINAKKVYYLEDRMLSFKRYEVLCRECNSHLGHIFNDGPPPKNFRYTINSIALIFQEQTISQ